ncbi:hypothetical protein GTP55_02830 [Duganella sp. FT109W]|uniref:Uncharacterized protein n=1 Tax=Duganella margarita TaxID=2692170 RepID=A0ABW9WCZ3_9BURK|nr:hypothetical protein [Duganella margarita]MYN38299.1 hypothetical protein [Duganella margarita]
MSHITSTKRSAGMVFGDFFALIGVMAFMGGSQTLGAFLFVSGIALYTTTAAARWLIAKISRH